MAHVAIQLSDKALALIAQLQKEIFNRRRKKVSIAGVVETLVESGAKSQSDKRFATSWKNLISDIEKAAKVADAHGAKPANLTDSEWAMVLSHRTRAPKAPATSKSAATKSPARKPVAKAAAMKSVGLAKPAAKKSAVKKPAASKPAVAKAAVKKPVTKKAAVKKPVIGKPAAKPAAKASPARKAAASAGGLAKRATPPSGIGAVSVNPL